MEANPILVTDRTTDRLLDEAAARMRAAGEPTVHVELSKALLAAARTLDTERAATVLRAVLHFAELGTWQEKCQFLLAEPELLTDEALAMHGALATVQGEDDGAITIVRERIPLSGGRGR